MDESVHLGRIFGVRIGANWSLFLVFWLIVWELGAGQLPHSAPGHTTAAYYGAAVAAVVIFYGCLLAHELAHALVARHRKIEVEGIVLWLLGGVSKLRGEAVEPTGELRIAVAGPATSLALALAFFGFTRLSGAGHPNALLPGVLGWLGWINAMLGVFNLVPAFPLDGGRVLRAALWRRNGDKRRATRAAAHVGGAFGYGFIGVGVLSFVAGGGGVGGLWLAFIGWFLLSASRSESSASTLVGDLGGSRARDAMTPNPLTVPGWVTLDRLMDEGVYKRRLTSFPVVDASGAFAGLITLARIRQVAADRWPATPCAAVATPPAHCVTCGPDDDLPNVARRMAASPDRRAVVLWGRQVIGIITPSDIARMAARRAPAGLSA